MFLSENVLGIKENIIDKILAYLDSKSKMQLVNIIVPSDIYYRTELMCKCISSDLEIEWGVIHFIFFIYESFIQEAIEKYNPSVIKSMINRSCRIFQSINITIDGEDFSYSRYDNKVSKLTIKLDKEEAAKGELIISEIEELFGYKLSFDELITLIWIDYIEEYKKGNNKKAYKTLYKLIEKEYE